MSEIARRIIWFEPPERALADPVRFLAYAMTYAQHQDMREIRRHVTDEEFRDALDQAPPGIIDARSWAYWNSKMGRYPPPPPPVRRFPNAPNRAGAAVVVGLAFALLAAAWPWTANADEFTEAHFDAASNELVVTISYRGTNPNHAFSLQWGPCRPAQNGSGNEISADVLDNQALDVEQQDFVKTTRFPLANFRCRPARVTLRTAPRFLYTVQIPAA